MHVTLERSREGTLSHPHRAHWPVIVTRCRLVPLTVWYSHPSDHSKQDGKGASATNQIQSRSAAALLKGMTPGPPT